MKIASYQEIKKLPKNPEGKLATSQAMKKMRTIAYAPIDMDALVIIDEIEIMRKAETKKLRKLNRNKKNAHQD